MSAARVTLVAASFADARAGLPLALALARVAGGAEIAGLLAEDPAAFAAAGHALAPFRRAPAAVTAEAMRAAYLRDERAFAAALAAAAGQAGLAACAAARAAGSPAALLAEAAARGEIAVAGQARLLRLEGPLVALAGAGAEEESLALARRLAAEGRRRLLLLGLEGRALPAGAEAVADLPALLARLGGLAPWAVLAAPGALGPLTPAGLAALLAAARCPVAIAPG